MPEYLFDKIIIVIIIVVVVVVVIHQFIDITLGLPIGESLYVLQ